MTDLRDLRDRIAEFDAAARRLLEAPPRLVLVNARPARCHPGRPVCARGLCRSCYKTARLSGTLHRHPTKSPQRFRADFVADYELLRSEGYTRRQIAERLRMNLHAVRKAYTRAVRAGDLTPDRRTA